MQHPPSRRHLPVVKPPESQAAPQTSVWLWVLYGCIIIIALWVPLAMVALLFGGRIGQWLARSSSEPPSSSPVLLAPAAVLVLLAFALACGIGGAVLGRFSQNSRMADAALAAGTAIAILLVFATLGHALPSLSFWWLVSGCLLIVGLPSAIAGHRWGRRRAAPAEAERDSGPY